MLFNHSLSRADAIARYTEVAHRMPEPNNPGSTRYVNNLSELADDIDVFVLDGYGVLNVGTETIPGAVERVSQLQSMGKQVLVLTNGATVPVEQTVEKYAHWGMQFEQGDVVSSRNALEVALESEKADFLWGAVATDFAHIDQLAPNIVLLEDNADDYARVDGFIFLSTLDWRPERYDLLQAALTERSRPMFVGNPDLVAPREDSMSLEPGLFSHALADLGLCEPKFYGKPFKPVFDLVAKRIHNVPPERIAMVGDTLHTDILGGSSYGWRTVLIKNHGLMKEADDEQTIAATGIRPDFIAATT